MIIMQEILDMSVAERILIIEKIWDTIEHKDIETSEVHQQELDRRLARYENGETAFVSWDDIKKELRNKK